MSEKGTIKIPREDFERHNERRKANGQTWAEYIDGEAPDEIDVEQLIDEIGSAVGGPRVDDSEIAREVSRQVDYAELAKQVADELEGRLR